MSTGEPKEQSLFSGLFPTSLSPSSIQKTLSTGELVEQSQTGQHLFLTSLSPSLPPDIAEIGKFWIEREYDASRFHNATDYYFFSEIILSFKRKETWNFKIEKFWIEIGYDEDASSTVTNWVHWQLTLICAQSKQTNKQTNKQKTNKHKNKRSAAKNNPDDDYKNDDDKNDDQSSAGDEDGNDFNFSFILIFLTLSFFYFNVFF